MTETDSRKTFFRQSGWMMASNMIGGVFMMLANLTAVGVTPASDYSVFITILRLFVLITLPAAGMQTLLAHQTAAAVTDDLQCDLSATIRGLLKLTVGFWLALFVVAGVFRIQIAQWLQASNANIIWIVMALILAALWFPIFQGLLQGLQKFFTFGWATVLNGLGRFIAILIGVKLLHISAIGATFGAFGGFLTAILLMLWPARSTFAHAGGTFGSLAFLKRLALLTAGAGSTLFLINVDMLLVQAHFEKGITSYYAGAETIGIALVTLCVPVAAVMFPKIVRSRATASSSNALSLAVWGTAVVGGAAALFCTILPEFPLRILFSSRPEMLKAAPLIPWFMWAMIPITMYNVLVNNLIARERYGIIPFAALLPIAYAITLHLFLSHNTLEPFAAFKRVIQILMAFSSTLLAISIWFSLRASSADAAATRSPSTTATPS